MNKNNLHIFQFTPLKKSNRSQFDYLTRLQDTISNNAPLERPKLKVDMYDLYPQKIQQKSQKIKTQVHNIEFIDWWQNISDDQINVFKTIFKDQNKNIKIYSVFGGSDIKRNKNTLYIQFSGESYYKNPNLFDINFIPYPVNTQNIVIFPYAAFHTIIAKISTDYFLNKREYNSTKFDDNFCLFVVSNGACKQRNYFYKELSKYKRVDSGGKFLNNMETKIPDGHGSKEYFNFISNYKFMICFENVSRPNYFTEKIINAYYNGTIPIYWGCPNIGDYINLDSILYLKPNFTENDVIELIDTIKFLDDNPEEYKKKYESVFFKDGVLPDEFDIDKIRNNINKLINKT
jgi:hypothetical protein